MDKIRIGKDIRINWEITSTDESVILSKDNLTLEMTVPSKCVAILPFTFNDNVLSATFYGIDQKQLGNYWLTVWYKRNEVGQSALDKVLAFQLVKSTEEETHNDESIAYAEVNLSGVLEINKGGGGVNLEYYSEDTERGTAKIDIGNCSADFDPTDGGTITIFATHTDIHDDNRNSQLTVGGGVSINTKNGNRLTYNNVEVATKSDVSNCATKSELNTHTNNTNIHVTAEDKTRWDAKQDSGDYATNTYVNTELAKKQNVGDYATNSQLNTHTSNTTVHVTAADKTRWDGKQDSGNYAKVDTTNTFTNPQLINAPIGNNNKVWKNVYQPFFTKRIHTAVIYTSIPYGGKMPYLRFTGNPYKDGKIVDFGLTWYVFNDNFINYGCCNNGTFLPPNIYLFSYTKNNSKYVAIGLYTGGEYSDSWYYMTFNIDIYSIQQPLLSTSVSGWTNSYIEQSDTTTKLIPDVGTDDCVLVPQKPILSNINGDSTSVNGYSITNVTALPSNPNANTIYLITDS